MLCDTIFKVFGVFLCFEKVFAGDGCGVYYEAVFSEEIVECSGFTNKMVDCDGLKLGSGDSSEGEGGMSMHGNIKLDSEIKDGHAAQFVIWKETEMGNKEFVNGARWDICKNLHNKDSPWYPLLVCLGISACPIPPRVYAIDKLTVSLESAKDVMNHEFVGEYQVEMAIIDDLDKLSCHVTKIAIVERKNEECDDESYMEEKEGTLDIVN